MKKIFRMAMVCALAGATLLYTGCTKDYSEDISNLESRLNTLEGTTIKSLQDQVKDLENARKALEDAKQKAESAIETLQGKVKDLETAVYPAVKNNTADINTLKTDVKNLKDRVQALEDAKVKIDSAIQKINDDLAKKADKTYVDDELAKKADLQYVKDTYATIKYVDDAVAELKGTLQTVQGEITNIKGDLDVIKPFVDSARVNISDLQKDMSQAKSDIKDAKKAADDAQADASKALSDISEIKDALKAIYTKAEVDAIVKSLDSTIDVRITNLEGRVAANENAIESLDSTTASHRSLINTLNEQVADAKKAIDTLKDTKLDIAAYKADTAVLGAKIRSIDAKIAQVIEDYQNADTKLSARIDSLADVTNDLYETKLDKETFESFAEEVNGRLEALEADVAKLLKRIQSLVYVPDYADGKIRMPYALLADADGYVTMPDGCKHSIESFSRGGDYSRNYRGYPAFVGTKTSGNPIKCDVVIEKETKVKFRVYGEDAATLAEALTQATDSLAFDVVSVRPNVRVNEDSAAVDIKAAAIDELDKDIIVLTVKANSLGDEFYIGGSCDDLGGPESWSMSLVLTDAEKSNLIQSCYVNMVPGDRAEALYPGIYKQDEKGEILKDGKNYVCMNNKMDTLEVEYTNTEKQDILPSIEFFFAKGDTLLTYDEMIAAGYSIPEPADTLYNENYGKPWAFTDLSKAIDASKLPEDYFIVDSTSYEYAPVGDAEFVPATIKLNGVHKEGVYAKKFDLVEITVAGCKVGTAQLTKVTPVKVTVNAHIWESETVDPFTWAYTLDAANDSIALAKDTVNVSSREGAVVKISEDELKKLEDLDVDLSDFDHKAAAEWAVLCGEDTCKNIEVYPYFKDGELFVNVSGFEWDKEYEVVAVYNLPTDAQPAIEVTVKAGFETVDRKRDDIVITLPESVFDFDVAAIDTTFNVKNEATSIVISLAEAGLTDPDVADALMNHPMDTAKTLELVYPDDTLKFNITDNGPSCNHKTVQIFAEGCEPDAMDVTTLLNLHSLFFRQVDTLATQYDYTDTVDLWYGQRVIVEKTIKINNENVFEFERINEYVVWDPKNTLHTSYTTLQPWWTPDDATLDFNIPVETYDAHKVLLDQHFRVRKQKGGDQVTNLDGTIKDEYSYLHREFVLENNGVEVKEIADPRNAAKADSVAQATGVKVADNIVEYYSMSEYTDVYGHLYAKIPENGAIMPLVTRFDKPNTTWPVEVNQVADEDYTKYAIKLYDPLKELNAPEETQEVNINNSVVRPTSIYDFLSLKDKRDKELIDGKSANGWVLGDDENGFKAGVTADEVYSLTFTNTMEFESTVSAETKARIKFDAQTGKITFDNTLQTQLAEPIIVKLGIKVEYPWGQRKAEVSVKFYNTPVGE
mgnify:CR=1 FL=1